MCEEERIFSKIFNMFVWTSGFQKSLAHTDFNMFVDEWTSANESPECRVTGIGKSIDIVFIQ